MTKDPCHASHDVPDPQTDTGPHSSAVGALVRTFRSSSTLRLARPVGASMISHVISAGCLNGIAHEKRLTHIQVVVRDHHHHEVHS